MASRVQRCLSLTLTELVQLSSSAPCIRAAMSAAGASLRQQLQKIAAQWPGDPFRPNVQLKTFLASLADHPNLTPEAVRATRALQNDELMKKVSLMIRMPALAANTRSSSGVGRVPRRMSLRTTQTREPNVYLRAFTRPCPSLPAHSHRPSRNCRLNTPNTRPSSTLSKAWAARTLLTRHMASCARSCALHVPTSAAGTPGAEAECACGGCLSFFLPFCYLPASASGSRRARKPSARFYLHARASRCLHGSTALTVTVPLSLQYPLSAKTLQPASMPHHYTRLVEAFDKSAQGIARPWWKIFFNIW